MLIRKLILIKNQSIFHNTYKTLIVQPVYKSSHLNLSSSSTVFSKSKNKHSKKQETYRDLNIYKRKTNMQKNSLKIPRFIKGVE